MHRNNIPHRYFLILIFGLILGTSSVLKPNQPPTFQWHLGEELTYRVKWSFIRLGTLRLQLRDTLTINNQFVYHIQLRIDSNPVLFFVNIHNVYNSYLDDKYRLYLFHSKEKIDGIEYLAEYKFDYQNNRVYMKYTSMDDPNKVIIRDEPINETILDGSGLIYYTRSHLDSVHTDTVTSFFEGRRGKVRINFYGITDPVKINAYNRKLPAFYVDGNVGMKAVAGLTGPFKGWFAVDAQRPPLKAELKVFIGHVSLELESWKNWMPPVSN